MANVLHVAMKQVEKFYRPIYKKQRAEIARLRALLKKARGPVYLYDNDPDREGSMAIGSMVLSSLVSSVTQSVLLPATRELGYHVNYLSPNVVPDVNQILSAYYADGIGFDDAETLLRYNGVRSRALVAGDPVNTATMRCWRAIIDKGRPLFSVGEAKGLYDRQIITASEFRTALSRAGITEGWVVDKYLQNNALPSLEQYSEAYLQGRIGVGEYADAIVRTEGIHDEVALSVLLGQRTPIEPEQVRARWYAGTLTDEQARSELGFNGYGIAGDWDRFTSTVAGYSLPTSFDLYWRGLFGEDELRKWMQYNGAANLDMLINYRAAQLPIPDVSTLATIDRRRVADPAIAARYGLDEGMGDVYLNYSGTGGLGYVPATEFPALGGPADVTWTALLWRAGHSLLPLATVIDGWWRMRPDRMERFASLVPGVQQITNADLEYYLRAYGYTSVTALQIGALSANVLDARSVRRLYMLGKRDTAWAVAQLMDRRYLADDAQALVDRWDAELEYQDGAVARSVETRTARALITEIVEGYKDGWVSRADAVSRLNAHALPAAVIEDMLDIAEGQVQRGYLREYIRRAKADYFAGTMSATEVALRLAAVQIVPERIAMYVQRWTLMLTTRRRALSGGQVLSLAKQGILSTNAASVRLANLGWVDGDIALQIAGVQRQLSLAQQRAVAAQGRARVQASKQLAQAARQSAGLRKQAIAALRAMYPKAELRRWLKEGIVNGEYVAARLREQQRSPDYIARFLADAGYVKPKAPKAPKAPKGAPPASGGAAPPGGGG